MKNQVSSPYPLFIRQRGSIFVAMAILAVFSSQALNLAAEGRGATDGRTPGSEPTDSTPAAAASTSSASSSSSSTATTSNSSSDAVPATPGTAGVLWTAPNYQVHQSERFKPKELPADVAPADLNRPTTAAPNLGVSQSSANAGITAVPADPNLSGRKLHMPGQTSDFIYDVAAAKQFSQAVTASPQYVWLSPDRPSPASQYQFKQNRVLASTEQLGRLDTYIRDLTQRIQANLSVPQSAQLVEMSNRKYSYLVSFVIKNSGQITNVTTEKQAGSLSAVPLADDTENSTVVNALTRALAKSAPVRVPPAGFAPWYMLMKYDVNTGKVFVACLNAK